MRECEDCPAAAVPGERYCKGCRAALLRRLREAGYLTPHYRYRSCYRSRDQKENVHETKHGTGH